eukprot:scaffold198159_cov27-Tisochrysis_lutea.AAC.1
MRDHLQPHCCTMVRIVESSCRVQPCLGWPRSLRRRLGSGGAIPPAHSSGGITSALLRQKRLTSGVSTRQSSIRVLGAPPSAPAAPSEAYLAMVWPAARSAHDAAAAVARICAGVG